MTTAAEDPFTHAEIAERIEDAVETLRRMPDRERTLLFSSQRGQQWPTMLHSAAEHAAWAKPKMRRPPPTSGQIGRMDEVLDWLLALARQDKGFFRAVWLMCGERRGPSQAARILGCHRDTARTWRDNGLERIARMQR